MATSNATSNNSNYSKTIENDKIDALWVMSKAKAEKDSENNIVNYLCYCDDCKVKSSSGKGGLAFNTAEDLLTHRKMEAFICPAGCGFHICSQRWSIISHLKSFYHQEILTKLEQKGLDVYKSYIYPDYINKTYTLNKPEPEFTEAPIKCAAEILSISQPKSKLSFQVKTPKRVSVPNSPVPPSTFPICESSIPTNLPKFTKKKVWTKLDNPSTNFSDIIKQQASGTIEETSEETENIIEIFKNTTHYAQMDMRKEIQCPDGIDCIKKDRPFACALNHDGLGDIIKYGTILSEDILCLFERPPFVRCKNGYCTKIHLEGRAAYIESLKKRVIPTNKLTTELTKHEYKNNSSEVSIVDNNTINIDISEIDAIAIAEALSDIEIKTAKEQEYDGPWLEC
jgi:hypothetical protein